MEISIENAGRDPNIYNLQEYLQLQLKEVMVYFHDVVII